MMIRLMGALILSAVMVPAAAQVYRCEHDSVIEFSDRPCDEQARLHQDGGRMSVVEPSADLAEIGERNRAFIEARRESIAAARQARRERQQAQQSTTDAQLQDELESVILAAPWMFENQAERAQQQSRTPPESDRSQRFSATGGRLPGTRRPDNRRDDDDRRDDRQQEDEP